MTLDTPEAREALEFIAGMYADGLMVSNTAIDAGWSGEAYGQGKAAMTMEGNWIVNRLGRTTSPTARWPTPSFPLGRAGRRDLRLHRLLRSCRPTPPTPRHRGRWPTT